MQTIREILRRLLGRKPYSERLAELRSLERDPRSRYHREQHKVERNDKR